LNACRLGVAGDAVSWCRDAAAGEDRSLPPLSISPSIGVHICAAAVKNAGVRMCCKSPSVNTSFCRGLLEVTVITAVTFVTREGVDTAR
jgi:hypothetical protein